MKIGIITLNSHANYGGILQAYALSTILKTLGHDAKVVYLPVRWNLPWYKKPWVYVKRWVEKLKDKDVVIFREKYLTESFAIVSKKTQSFIDKYTPHILVDCYTDLQEKDWDVLVVGSDQVWRPDYITGNVEHFFLKFAEKWNVKRVAYAASLGVDIWLFKPSQDNSIRRLIKKFDAVSVREESAIHLCKEHWDIDAKLVLDPTFLLKKMDYESLVIKSNTPVSPGNLLCYVLDENEHTKRIIKFVESNNHLKSFRVNSRYEDYSAPLNERIQPSVEQWLRGFMDADMVVTDSFHACVFSIIFNKPFVVVGNNKRGNTRFDSLLKTFGLADRFLYDINDIERMNSTIDWDSVNAIIEELRNLSLNFIKLNLS